MARRATLLATWNPAHGIWPERAQAVADTRAGGVVRRPWSTGGRRGGVEPGDRVFLLKQGREPRGIVGSGTCASPIYQDEHWDASRVGQEANHVLIDWDAIVDDDDLLPYHELVVRIPAGGLWRPQRSGTLLRPDVAAELELLWAERVAPATKGN